jgi:DNA repair protein RadD
MITRQYQKKAVSNLLKLLPEHQRVCAVAPTGSGKTVIGAALIRKLSDKRVLWIAHRIELLRQAYDQLLAAGVAKRDLGILSGPDKINEGARVLVASVAMFHEREVSEADLIVVDEAHRVEAVTYKDIIASQEDAWVLGLTATPWRLDGKGLDTFNEILVMATPTQMIVDGFVAKPICYGVPADRIKKILKGVGVAKREFAQATLGKAMQKNALMGDVVKDWERRGKGKATIVYAVTREHGQRLLRRFKRAGHAFEYLDGDTDQVVRADMLERLGKGKIDGIVNVDVLVEGVDIPRVKCIVMARPTKSLTRFLQQAGRASRPFGNLRPIILDHAGNCARFSLPNSEREWTLDGRESVPREGGGTVKECPGCEAMIPALARECPECGCEQPMTQRELSETDAELERLMEKQSERDQIEEVLKRLAASKGLPMSWVQNTLSSIA